MTSARGASLFVAAALATAHVGCSDPLRNAILELELVLPTSSLPDDTWAFVEAQPGEPDFLEPWPIDPDHPPGSQLDRLNATTEDVSLVATEEHPQISVRVRYCRTAGCTDPSDEFAPITGVRIAHPFYLGERTSVTIPIATIPPVLETLAPIDACEVRGCTDALLPTYCDELGAHLCAQ